MAIYRQHRKCLNQEKARLGPKLFTGGGQEARGLNPSLRRRHTSQPHYNLLYKTVFSWQALTLVPRLKSAKLKTTISIFAAIKWTTSYFLFPPLLPQSPRDPKGTAGYLGLRPLPGKHASRILLSLTTRYLALESSSFQNDQNQGRGDSFLLLRDNALYEGENTSLLNSEGIQVLPQQMPLPRRFLTKGKKITHLRCHYFSYASLAQSFP